jgi:hypothetical protein
LCSASASPFGTFDHRHRTCWCSRTAKKPGPSQSSKEVSSMYAMMMIELIYLLYTSTVYRLCTNSHANHCVLYAITPQSPRCGSSPSAARIRQGNGSRQVARHGAPRRHCNPRRMIRLQRAPAAPAAGFLRQRLRRAPPAGKPAPEAGGLGRCLRMAVSGGPSPAAPAAGRRAYVPYGGGRRLWRAGPVAPAG